MMSGARLAKNYVTNYLANDLPARLVGYRNEWNLSQSQLPEPVRYLSYEPFALDRWPTIITLVLSTDALERVDMYSSDPTYRVTYEMRTYVWVRDSGADVVTEQRDNLSAIVREALMDGPSLSSYDSSVPCSPKIDEGTISEQFSDLTLIKGERLLAGAYVGYSLTLEETISHDPVGIVTATQAEVDLIEITPNAPTRLAAVAGDQQVSLAWHESTWNGGVYNITGYAVQQSEDGGDTWTTVTSSTDSTTPYYVVTGLSNGDTYRFRVAAVNNAGVGAYSSSSTAVSPSE
jgi:hypothetical protein